MCASAPVNLPPVQTDIKSLCEMEKEMQGEYVVVIKPLEKIEGWRDGSRDGGKGSEEVRDANRG